MNQTEHFDPQPGFWGPHEISRVWWRLARALQFVVITYEYRKTLFSEEAKGTLLCAPNFFNHYDVLSLAAIVTGICRLNDPPKMRSNKNISFSRLRGILEPRPDAARIDPVIYAEFDELDILTRGALKDARQKIYAHFDMDAADGPLLPLPPETEVERTMKLMHQILDRVSRYYWNDQPLQEVNWTYTEVGGAKALIEHYNKPMW